MKWLYLLPANSFGRICPRSTPRVPSAADLQFVCTERFTSRRVVPSQPPIARMSLTAKMVTPKVLFVWEKPRWNESALIDTSLILLVIISANWCFFPFLSSLMTVQLCKKCETASTDLHQLTARAIAPVRYTGAFRIAKEQLSEQCDASTEGHDARVVIAAYPTRRLFARRSATLVEKRQRPCKHGARTALQSWGPDKRQLFPRFRVPPPYSTWQKSNGYEKSGDRCQIICFLHFALAAHRPPPTTHCPPLPAHYPPPIVIKGACRLGLNRNLRIHKVLDLRHFQTKNEEIKEPTIQRIA